MENCLRAGNGVVRGEIEMRDVEEDLEMVLRGAARRARLAGKVGRRFLLATVRRLRLNVDILGWLLGRRGEMFSLKINCKLEDEK